jgi:hypothetical protein
MPTRYLKPGIRDSEAIDALSPDAEVLFYRLIVTVDDFGRADARPAMVKAACFPIRSRLGEAQCAELLRELVGRELVTVYEVAGKPYMQLRKWDNIPRAKESKFPAPSDNCAHLHATVCSPRTVLPVTETETETGTDNREPEPRSVRAPDPEDRRGEVVPLPEPGSLAPGVVCAALKAAGVQRVNPSNPDLHAFLSVGGTIEELLPLVPSALSKGDPFAYILKAAINKRKDAAASVGQMARGAVVAPVTVPGKSTGALAELADHAAQTQTPEAKAAARAAVQALKQRMNVS